MMEGRRCTCTTGTEGDGWHEVRCADCLQDELDVWAEMMDRSKIWLASLRSRR